MKTPTQPLSPEEHAALRAFAARHGRTWKAHLRHAWMDASEPGTLQRLRNAHYFGPHGLTRYRLTDDQEEEQPRCPDCNGYDSHCDRCSD